MSAETADNAGTPQLKQFHMVSIKEFPRGINSDQVISEANSTEVKRRASWSGPQASSFKLSNQPVQASSDKHKPQAQASSFKPQAQAPDPRTTVHGY